MATYDLNRIDRRYRSAYKTCGLKDGHPTLSDIGAHVPPLFISIQFNLRDLFLVICATTACGFVVSQGIDRFVRHRHRLGPNLLEKEFFLSQCSMFFSLLAGLALIMISAFNVPYLLDERTGIRVYCRTLDNDD